jgi:hypothetical protein
MNQIHLFCGNNYGDLVVYNVDLKNKEMKLSLNSYCQTNFIQTFNNIDYSSENQFLVSDEGMLCVLRKC